MSVEGQGFFWVAAQEGQVPGLLGLGVWRQFGLRLRRMAHGACWALQAARGVLRSLPACRLRKHCLPLNHQASSQTQPCRLCLSTA